MNEDVQPAIKMMDHQSNANETKYSSLYNTNSNIIYNDSSESGETTLKNDSAVLSSENKFENETTTTLGAGPEFTCERCGAIFENQKLFERHRSSKVKTCCTKSRVCSHCGQTLGNLNAYRKHIIHCWRSRRNKKKKEALEAARKIKELENNSENDSKTSNASETDKIDVLKEVLNKKQFTLKIKQEKIDNNETTMPITIQIKQEKIFEEEALNNDNDEIIYDSSEIATKSEPLVDFRSRIPEIACSVCKVEFRSLAHYTLHQKRKFPCRAEPYVCKICGQEFSKIYHLDAHEKRKSSCLLDNKGAGRKPKKPKLELTFPDLNSTPPPEIMETINVEGLGESSNTEMPHLEVPPSPPLSSTSKTANVLSQNVNTPLYECNLCDAKFLYPSLYKRHMKALHKNNKPKNKVGRPSRKSKMIEKSDSTEIEHPEPTPPTSATSSESTEPAIHPEFRFSQHLTSNGYVCFKCGKIFPYPYRLKNHLSRKVPCTFNSKDDKELVLFNATNLLLNASVLAADSNQSLIESTNEIDENQLIKRNSPLEQKVVQKSKRIAFQNGSKKPVKAVCKLCHISFMSRSGCYKHCSRLHNGLLVSSIINFLNVKNEPGGDEEEVSNDSTEEETSIDVPDVELLIEDPNKIALPSGKIVEKKYINEIKCTDCDENFRFPYLMLQHKRKMHSLYAIKKSDCFTCPFCNKSFQSLKARNSHLKPAHKHQLLREIEIFIKSTTCSFCKHTFSTEAVKLDHEKTVHISSPVKKNVKIEVPSPTAPPAPPPPPHFHHAPLKSHICPHCNAGFTTKHHHTSHIKRYCKLRTINPGTLNAESSKPQEQQQTTTKDIFYCEGCDMKLNSKTLYKAHVNRFCPLKSDPKSKRKDIKQELFGLDDKVYLVCEFCNMDFSRKIEYDVHVRDLCTLRPNLPHKDIPRTSKTETEFVNTPDGIVPSKHYTCPDCKIIYPTRHLYTIHKRLCGKETNNLQPPENPITTNIAKTSMELKLEPLEKPISPQPSIVTPTLNLVVPKTAPNSKKINSCPFCTRTFNNSHLRDRHVRTHTLEKMFSCSDCPFKFSRSEYLTRHMQSEHPDSLKYQCVSCLRRYPTFIRCLHHVARHHPGLQDRRKFVKVLPGGIETPEEPKVVSSSKTISIPKTTTIIKDIESESMDTTFTNVDDKHGYSCSLCKMGNFPNMAAIDRHRRSKKHHMNSLRNRGKWLTKRSIDQLSFDNSKSDDNSLECSVCMKTFSSIAIFIPHRLSHFNSQHIDPTEISQTNPYACEICSKTFNHHQKVQAHFLWHLREHKLPRVFSKDSVIQLPEITEKQQAGIPKIVDMPNLLMHISAKKTTGPSTLLKSQYNTVITGPNNSLLFVCDFCDVTYNTKKPLLLHMKMYCPKRYHCIECKQYFPMVKSFANHKRYCKGTVTLKCKHCFLEFTSQNDLGWHEKSCLKVNESGPCGSGRNNSYLLSVLPEVNENEHFIQCILCKENFYQLDTLESHFEESHPEEEFQVICLACDLTFSDSEETKFHVKSISATNDILSNLEEKNNSNSTTESMPLPYIENYNNNIKLNSAINTLASKIGPRADKPVRRQCGRERKVQPSKCPYCHLKFKIASRLKFHLVTHEPFVCPVCNNEETTTEGLYTHPCILPDGTYATGIQHRKKWHVTHGLKTVVKKIKQEEIQFQWEEVTQNQDIKTLDSLRSNFSKLINLLVEDAELMTRLGLGKRLIDDVLKDVLNHLGHNNKINVIVDGKNNALDNLRIDISFFLKICIKDDILVDAEKNNESIDNVVLKILKECLDSANVE